MRCPKCGYISFDYNQVCPKCNKNSADEQAKPNIPAFRPTPPSLLGVLTGEADESNIGLESNLSRSMSDSNEMDVGLDESVGIGTSETELDEGQDLDEIGLKQEDSGDFELSGEEETLAVDSEEISIEDTDSLITPSAEGEGEGKCLDIEDTSMDLHIDLDKEAGGEEKSEIELNLNDLKINETGELEIEKDLEPAKEAGGGSLDLGDP